MVYSFRSRSVRNLESWQCGVEDEKIMMGACWRMRRYSFSASKGLPGSLESSWGVRVDVVLDVSTAANELGFFFFFERSSKVNQ